jgi:flagellar basal-body rod protein FlgF
MENVLLIALSRQMALSRELDVISNNVANVQTNGFKRRTSETSEFRMPVASEDTFRRGDDRRISYVIDRGTALDTSLGKLEPTGNPLDIALSDEAYLVVQTPKGERYTRNGALMINSQGQLVTSDGFAVMGEQGEYQFGATEKDIRIASDGTLTTSGGVRGKLRLVKFQNQQSLENVGANLFTTKAQAEPALQARVQAGYVERSNVHPVTEISRMIEVTRQYQAIANMMSRTDESRRTAIQKLGEPI